MSPEALILQPKVTEVRAGIWACPSVGVVGSPGTREAVGAVGVRACCGFGGSLWEHSHRNCWLVFKYFACNIDACKGHGRVQVESVLVFTPTEG